MLARRYEIVSVRPTAGELLVRYLEGQLEMTLNLPTPAHVQELHRHILRNWPCRQFREMRMLQEIASAPSRGLVEISSADVEMFALEEIDE